MSDSIKELPPSNIGKYIQFFGFILALGVVGYSYIKKEGFDFSLFSQTARTDRSMVPSRFEVSSTARKNDTIQFPTQQVLSATVSVKTPWGESTGFFLTEKIIITCRQVVEFNPVEIKQLQEQVNSDRKLLDLEEEKLNSFRERLSQKNTKRSKEALKLLISERKKYLADFRYRYEQDMQRLAKQKKGLKNQEIKITLFDGGEQSATLVQMSQDYDIALLNTALVPTSAALNPPQQTTFLRKGASLYLPDISPDSSKKITKTSFTGYRRIGVQNQMFLQIDGTIPPHQSGSPILDTTGTVWGVTTRAVHDKSAASFVIPIEKVYEEFADVFQEK